MESWPFAYDEILSEELAPFRVASAPGPLLAALLAETRRRFEGSPLRTVVLVAVNRTLHERIAYVVREEPGVYAPEETLARARGSCRDSAWLQVTLLRHLGYAARFVSGYLIQLVADTKPVDGGPAGPEADFTDLHAWAEVYLPGAGWVGLDATSGLFAGEGHIPLAATASPQSAAPISGTFSVEEGTGSRFTFEMAVRRVSETPRVTKPYTPTQWQAILAQGASVDAALRQAGVRLWMGGAPTFISATDREAAEWKFEALGPTKRAYAGRLLRKLFPLWGPGAALTYSLGKQYPGEPLQRWAPHAHWRADGEPVWNDRALLASDDDADDAGAPDAERFAQALAERLGLPPELVRPAYEDIHYYL
ncbi:transglutaminase family protein [Verrucomicrobium sp. 3C]|uniref:transglutaminase family protein n=1 Tax=Verrucomicrobium sp. 3C TaxID=1134055 RepID=UPI00037E004E|nr:transglutaminase family protein [Verrucomicrobium sp. 3C]